MRVLHVIDSLSPECGGPPEAVCQFVKAFLDSKTEVEVVCLDSPDAPFLKRVGCPVHALGQTYLGRFAFSPRLWRWLRKNAGHYDCLVMDGVWTFPGVAMAAAARRAHRPYGVYAHGALDPWFNRQYPLKHLKKRLFWGIQYWVLHHATAVFFTSQQEKKLAAESFSPNQWNSVVVPYGTTDPVRGIHSVEQCVADFYAKFPHLRGRRNLLYMSRIHEKKGCDLLVEAFAKYARQYPDLDLVIAGPDRTGLRAKLEARAAELGIAQRICWPGMLTGNLKWGALHACEAMVLPSHQENFGIVVAESLAMGRPVLLSKQVNIWPEVESGHAGLVEEDTLEGTERLLGRWLAMSKEEREKMAGNARPTYLNRFSMERTVDLMKKVLTS